jgi:thiamine pyrophosphokinase
MPAEEFTQRSFTLPRRRVFFMPVRRAVLFANGKLENYDWLKSFLRGDDLLIAVDGGLSHLEALNLTPALLLGDLDSVTPAQVERAQAAGVEIRRYPPVKDETDLELALLTARERGFDEIVVVAALGGRLDQTLGNLSLLLLPQLEDCSVRFEDGHDEVFVIRASTEIHGQPGDVVSLLPLWGEVTGVIAANLAYPLNNETLHPERTRGISNEMTASTASVTITGGRLLCIHTHSQKMEKK